MRPDVPPAVMPASGEKECGGQLSQMSRLSSLPDGALDLV